MFGDEWPYVVEDILNTLVGVETQFCLLECENGSVGTSATEEGTVRVI